MVHCIIQKRYFMQGNLHLHQNLSLKIIFIFIYQILYSSIVNIKDIYIELALFCLGRKLDPKFVKMVTQYMYLQTLSIFSTTCIYQKIDYSSFLVCMPRQISTQSKIKTQLSGYKYMDYSYCLSDSKTGRVRKRKRNRKGTERKGENDRYLHIYFKIYIC